MENINDFLGKITEFLKSEAKTETIIGQQFQLGSYSCVPVMMLGMGFGSGGGEGKDKTKGSDADEGMGFGGGGGMGMRPIGFLVTSGTDIQFISTRSHHGLNNILDKAPELLEKIFQKAKSEQPKA